jgi:hypothetical protein
MEFPGYLLISLGIHGVVTAAMSMMVGGHSGSHKVRIVTGAKEALDELRT